MIKLNLKAETEEQKIIKDYLEQNVSETLAEKINNGVPITKDGKQLLNKKDLKGFWEYASKEAQKLAEQGAKVKAVWHETVYGWAINYFEEDSIEGKLLNLDGKEYKPEIKTQKYESKTETKTANEVNKQSSLFDILTPSAEEKVQNKVKNSENILNNTGIIESECKNIIIQEDYEPDPLFDEDDYNIDKNTGEVLPKITTKINKENEFVKVLQDLLDNKLILI